MTTAITGATGLLGRCIADHLRATGGIVRAISTRTPPQSRDLEGCDAIIHLAGEPVAQRWTVAARERIINSRVDGTRELVKAIGGLTQPPKVLLNASAIGYYGSRGDEILTESAGPGNDFLARVCVEWEREAQEAEKFGVRVARLRTSVVLAQNGGALEQMLTPFRLGVGGKIGDGRQWMSWIHIDDIAALMSFILATPALQGPVNASAPNPVINADFTRELARVLHRPAIFSVPRLVLKALLGEMAQVILASQRVIPEAASDAGFEFKFPTIGLALTDLLK